MDETTTTLAMEQPAVSMLAPRADDLSAVVITLLKGVVYQENERRLWSALIRLQGRVRDYIATLGLELRLDEAEGYAFVRSKPTANTTDVERDTEAIELPRLIARRQLSFSVSLLLALLRKKLAEFDASGADTRLVLSREEIADLVKVFLPAANNEAQILNKIDAHINKIVEMGFLRKLKPGTSREDTFEVRRILRAFVDAQWLSDFNERLAQYHAMLESMQGGESDE